MTYKRPFYIFCFMVLMALIGFMIHVAIEYPLLYLMQKDFVTYSFGLRFETWVLIHAIATPVLILGGAALGFRLGVYWWKKLYVDTHHTW